MTPLNSVLVEWHLISPLHQQLCVECYIEGGTQARDAKRYLLLAKESSQVRFDDYHASNSRLTLEMHERHSCKETKLAGSAECLSTAILKTVYLLCQAHNDAGVD